MKVLVNDNELQVENLKVQNNIVSLVVEGVSYRFSHQEVQQMLFAQSAIRDRAHAVVAGKDYFLQRYSCQNSGSADVGAMISPMPGKIFKVLKEHGQNVQQGDVILIMEAMKMEHPVKATRDGVIKDICYGEGEQVAGGVELVVLEEQE